MSIPPPLPVLLTTLITPTALSTCGGNGPGADRANSQPNGSPGELFAGWLAPQRARGARARFGVLFELGGPDLAIPRPDGRCGGCIALGGGGVAQEEVDGLVGDGDSRENWF